MKYLVSISSRNGVKLGKILDYHCGVANGIVLLGYGTRS